jgi:hypothetical protein
MRPAPEALEVALPPQSQVVRTPKHHASLFAVPRVYPSPSHNGPSCGYFEEPATELVCHFCGGWRPVGTSCLCFDNGGQ